MDSRDPEVGIGTWPATVGGVRAGYSAEPVDAGSILTMRLERCQ